MFKKCIVGFLFLSTMYVFCTSSVIKKRKKTTPVKKQKKEIVELCEVALDLSLELISLLGHISKKVALCVKKIVTGNDNIHSKAQCRTCKKQLEQYNQKVKGIIEEARSFSIS